MWAMKAPSWLAADRPPCRDIPLLADCIRGPGLFCDGLSRDGGVGARACEKADRGIYRRGHGASWAPHGPCGSDRERGQRHGSGEDRGAGGCGDCGVSDAGGDGGYVAQALGEDLTRKGLKRIWLRSNLCWKWTGTRLNFKDRILITVTQSGHGADRIQRCL